MGRTNCPACGADVDVAQDATTGESVVIETNTDSSNDAPRYRVVGFGPPIMVERVPDSAAGDFHPLHSFDCPGQNAGRTF